MTFSGIADEAISKPLNEVKTSPYPGRLSFLKTYQECQAITITTKAYVIKIPLRSASHAIRACKETFPESETWELHHFRRFAKPNILPAHVRSSDHLRLDPENLPHTKEDSYESNQGKEYLVNRTHNEPDCIWYFVGPANTIEPQYLTTLFSQEVFLDEEDRKPQIRIIDIPLSPPKSIEEALMWSNIYWPTIYKRMNPLGPHHSIVSHAEDAIGRQVDAWMALARLAAYESAKDRLGENFGCLVIERDSEGKGKLISIAADLRYGAHMSDSGRKQTESIFMHATMRAIGMVARKRKLSIYERDARMPQESVDNMVFSEDDQMRDVYGDSPATPIEKYIYDKNSPSADGYLCTDFEIYLTHEPCVMCSMAILHSRFGRCVFGKRMSASGGLFAEPANADDTTLQRRFEFLAPRYGLFWRPELNWKFLCWQWTSESEGNTETQIMQA